MFRDYVNKVAYKIKVILKNLLGRSKDKIESFAESVIYEINCKDWNEKCYGESRRFTRRHYGEQCDGVKYGRI